MATIVLKPRWQAWENTCIQTTLKHKIPHKIVAAALGRTATAVSKKIKDLTLEKQATEERPHLLKAEKRAQDLRRMTQILQDNAPLK